nr:hypothetical protein [Tanacetum cinerariifolium]
NLISNLSSNRYWILGVDQRDHRSLKAPAIVSTIPSSQMELNDMALGPQVKLLELDRSRILSVELVVDLANPQETLQESLRR